MRLKLRFFFHPLWLSTCSSTFYWKGYFFSIELLCTFLKNQFVYLNESAPEVSVLFHWFMFILPPISFGLGYCTCIINPEIGKNISFHFILFFYIFLTTLVPLSLSINFRIRQYLSTKKVLLFFYRNCINVCKLGEN